MISNLRLRTILGNFKIEGYTFDYEDFIARSFNMCIEEGMEYGKIVPSRAFCADESQGFPIILITKHFSAFPFDHGLVGGIMARGRNGAYAMHGKDLMIFQASHVGYNDDTRHFGEYRRLQTGSCDMSSNCGKVQATLDWYQREHKFASDNTLIEKRNNNYFITIDKLLFNQEYEEGLFLRLDAMVKMGKDGSKPRPLGIFSTSNVLIASPELVTFLSKQGFPWKDHEPVPLGEYLTPELFYFQKELAPGDHMEENLQEYMPWIVTSSEPMLSAAEVNVQIEFDRRYRSIAREKDFEGRNLIYLSGLNIDYSPKEGQLFSKTQFVPWAAYIQKSDGSHYIMEQDELYDRLLGCSSENPHVVDMCAAMNDPDGDQE